MFKYLLSFLLVLIFSLDVAYPVIFSINIVIESGYNLIIGLLIYLIILIIPQRKEDRILGRYE